MELKKFDQAIQTVCKCTEQVLSENVRMLNRYRQYYADIGKYCKEKEVYLQTQEDFEKHLNKTGKIYCYQLIDNM